VKKSAPEPRNRSIRSGLERLTVVAAFLEWRAEINWLRQQDSACSALKRDLCPFGSANSVWVL
jgi:hypothetical protein